MPGPKRAVHGAVSGYNAGCRKDCPASPSCVEARSVWSRARRAARRAGIDVTTVIPAAPAYEAIQRLHARDLTYREIATMSGVPWATLWGIVTDPGKGIRRDTARGILYAADHFTDRDRDPTRYPLEAFRRLSHGLSVLGYSNAWQVQQLGNKGAKFSQPAGKKYVSATVMRRMQMLVRRVGRTPATPDNTGERQPTIDRVRANARRKGWRLPPVDPTLIHWSTIRPPTVEDDDLMPEPPPAENDASDRRFLAVLRSMVLEGASVNHAAARHGYEPASRLRALNLRFSYDRELGRSFPRPESAAVAAAAATVLREMPIDMAALARGSWTVADIDEWWSATAAWAEIKARCADAAKECVPA